MATHPAADALISGFPDSGLLKRLPIVKRQRLIGDILALFMLSPFHAVIPIGDICVNILGAVDANQFKLYRRGDRIVGYVSWAYLSDDIHELYKTGDYRLRPVDWKSGPHGWIIDFLAPLGDTRGISRDLRHNVFPNEKGHTFRAHRTRRGDGIRVLRGAKARHHD